MLFCVKDDDCSAASLEIEAPQLGRFCRPMIRKTVFEPCSQMRTEDFSESRMIV